MIGKDYSNLIDDKEVKELISRNKNKEKGQMEILVSKTKILVSLVAIEYGKSKIELQCLKGVGIIALLEAIEKFNHELSYPFYKYAIHIIRPKIFFESIKIKRFMSFVK